MDIIGVQLAPPAVVVPAEGRLRRPEGGISDPRTGQVAHLPELDVQLLPDPLRPWTVVRNRGDDEESASVGPVDGVNEGLMPVKNLFLDLLQAQDAGVPDVVGSAADDVAAGVLRLQHRLAKRVDPAVGEPPSSVDEVQDRTGSVALSLV